MKYRKFETGAYCLHVVNTDKFKTVNIRVNFKQKVKKEDVTYRALLAKILLESNEIYQNRKAMEIRSEELFNASIGIETYLSGNYIVTSFDTTFLNELYTEPGMNLSGIRFLLDVLFRPLIKEEQFEQEAFELAKKMVREDIETLKENPRKYGDMRLLEEMMPKEPLSYRVIGYEEDLDQITPKSLYQYYQNMLKSNWVDIFVVGSVDEDKMKKIWLEEFQINTLKKPQKDQFYLHKNIRSRSRSKNEKEEIEQSHLYLGFKVDKLSLFERQYVMSLYSFILGGGPSSKLFMEVREKNSLCYTIASRFSPFASLLTIYAGIDGKEAKKALRLIKKELKKMETGSFGDEEMNAAKTTYLSSFKELEDSPKAIISTIVSHEYADFDLLDQRTIEILKVTKEDIIKVAKKVHLDTIYLLEGSVEHD